MNTTHTGFINWLQFSRALFRARWSILSVSAVYLISVIVGISMVSSGNQFALEHRAQLVGEASTNDAAAVSNNQGMPFQAALLDFAGNLVIGSIPKSVMGIAIIPPFPFVAYQGWVGGIVSVRGDHSSRLNSFRSAFYYTFTILIQLAAYSITVGAGINLGIANLRPPAWYGGEKWWIFPKEAVRDWVRLYVVSVPLFLVGSLWEFMSTWNI
jgi:hypothetical protein